MRIGLALVLLCAVVAAAVPSAAFAGAQPQMLDGLYAEIALLPAVRVGNSLTAKLNAAQAAIDRGQPRTAIKQLNAFGHELNGRFIGNPDLLGAINAELARVIAELNVDDLAVTTIKDGDVEDPEFEAPCDAPCRVEPAHHGLAVLAGSR